MTLTTADLVPGDLPFAFGDDPVLDELHEECEKEKFAMCDELWRVSPAGSDYERFGATCGERITNIAANFGDCEATNAGSDVPFRLGDDPVLDELYAGCENGTLEACDGLWTASPIGSEYELFAATCGGRVGIEAAPAGACLASFEGANQVEG